MGEVGAIILVDRQTQTTLEGPYMIFEEVRVLIKVDCLKGQFSKSFSAIRVSAGVGGNSSTAEFAPCAIL